jgi:Domain of unknown function (DUF4136)
MRVATLSIVSLALFLSGCVVPTGPVEVTRFNRVAEGQAYGKGSFVVRVADDSKTGNGLSATPYLESVAREMQRLGYVEAQGGNNSDVVAAISVDVSERRLDRNSPVSVGVGGGTGGYGSGLGVGIGFNLGGGPKTQLVTSLSVKIRRSGDNLVIWEGNASQAAGKSSPAAQPGIAASKLASALFGNFPGQSGESISVP